MIKILISERKAPFLKGINDNGDSKSPNPRWQMAFTLTDIMHMVLIYVTKYKMIYRHALVLGISHAQ